MSDDRDARCRRSLKCVVGVLLSHAEAARGLLKHKAQAAPKSAEAQAWRLLDESTAYAYRWMNDAGGPTPDDTS